jgi:hypothetical protein
VFGIHSFSVRLGQKRVRFLSPSHSKLCRYYITFFSTYFAYIGSDANGIIFW